MKIFTTILLPLAAFTNCLIATPQQALAADQIPIGSDASSKSTKIRILNIEKSLQGDNLYPSTGSGGIGTGAAGGTTTGIPKKPKNPNAPPLPMQQEFKVERENNSLPQNLRQHQGTSK